jgi:ferredoxin-NADP reductase
VSKEYEVRLVESERCEDTLTLRFERPAGYGFSAGQYFMLGIETEAGREAKPFSHASSPRDELLEMTTRMSGSTFKRALELAEPNSFVARIRGPAGRFGLSAEDPGSPVFLAGGVGITPVMSILRDAAQREGMLGASLIYGNATEHCIPYRDEIGSFEGGLVRSTLVIEHAGEEWEGPSGFITAETVRGCVPDVDQHCYYVTGPPVMVVAMEAVLDDLGIEKTRRRVERFGR